MQESGAPVPPQPNRRKFKTGQFVRYARLLDARLANATMYRIARVMFSDSEDQERSARLAMETALRMAESDYRELLLLPSGAKPVKAAGLLLPR